MPNPIQSICTRWGSDPFSYGSYSHVPVQSSGSDYDILAESVGGRLYFAGEATIRQHPATMHGAYLSGLREASNILLATKARQSNARKSIQKSFCPSNDNLTDLFKKPDLACGEFLFVFDPVNEDPKSLGLMRVSFGKSTGDCNTESSNEKAADNQYQDLLDDQVQLYAVLSREQAQELLSGTGGTESKLSYLHKSLHLKLMGASGLGVLGNSLTAKIAAARRGRGRNRVSAGTQYAK